mgnify:CR=1 FL=1
MAKQFFVYIAASQRNGALYVGVTSDLPGRAWQHKNKVIHNGEIYTTKSSESLDTRLHGNDELWRWR